MNNINLFLSFNIKKLKLEDLQLTQKKGYFH